MIYIFLGSFCRRKNGYLLLLMFILSIKFDWMQISLQSSFFSSAFLPFSLCAPSFTATQYGKWQVRWKIKVIPLHCSFITESFIVRNITSQEQNFHFLLCSIPNILPTQCNFFPYIIYWQYIDALSNQSYLGPQKWHFQIILAVVGLTIHKGGKIVS